MFEANDVTGFDREDVPSVSEAPPSTLTRVDALARRPEGDGDTIEIYLGACPFWATLQSENNPAVVQRNDANGFWLVQDTKFVASFHRLDAALAALRLV